MDPMMNAIRASETVGEFIKQSLHIYVKEGGNIKLLNKEFIKLFIEACHSHIEPNKSFNLSCRVVSGYDNPEVIKCKTMECYIKTEDKLRLILELNVC